MSADESSWYYSQVLHPQIEDCTHLGMENLLQPCLYIYFKTKAILNRLLPWLEIHSSLYDAWQSFPTLLKFLKIHARIVFLTIVMIK